MNAILRQMALKAREQEIPFQVTIELTRSCNLHCRHCYHGPFDNHRLARESLQSIFAALAGAGTLELTFTGGEIFTHPQLIDIIGDARDAYFDVSFISNLTLLNENRAALLEKLGVRLVRTSIYFATAEKHDRFVGHDGAWVATIRALDLLYEHGIKTKVQVMLLDENISELAEIEKLCTAHHASCSGVYFMDPTNQLSEGPLAEIPSLKSLELSKNLWRQSSFIAWMKERQVGPELCGAALCGAFIDADGLLWPCINWPKAAGSLLKESLPLLWNGPVMQEARALLKGSTPCKSCEKRQFCSPCLGLNFKMTGSVSKPYPARCKQAEIYWQTLKEEEQNVVK